MTILMRTTKLPALVVALAVAVILLPATTWAGDGGAAGPDAYDPEAALRFSQSVIGHPVGEYTFLDSDGQPLALREFRGKPLLLSLVFTSCYHTCPVTTRHLARAVANAREVLGQDSFRVITLGFDTAHDTPEAMRNFARAQGIGDDGWRFLSGSRQQVDQLVADLGFIYFPSPRGFDHIVQTTLLDADGVVYRQVYGETFELPWLMEPLKDLVFGRHQAQASPIAGLVDRVRLFCTVYDPATGRYAFDYSLFIQTGVGLVMVLSVAAYLVREARGARRSS